MSVEHKAIRDEIDDLPGLKEKDMQPCAFCGQPHSSPVFYRVTLEQYVADANAMRRQLGLGMHLGSAALAGVMGPNEDMAKQTSSITVTVCGECALTTPILGVLGGE